MLPDAIHHSKCCCSIMSPEGNKISPAEDPLATISSLDSPTGVITRPLQVLNLIAKDEGLLLSLKHRVVFFLESRQPGAGFPNPCTLWSSLMLFAKHFWFFVLLEHGRIILLALL